MNEFLVQINNILNNSSLPRHNVAADRELPPDLWTADRVWVRRCGHVPPLTPLYDDPDTVIQRSLRSFKLQMGGKEDKVSTSSLKPCSSSLAGFLNAQRRGPRAATPADNAFRPQVSRTTASFSLITTKKLEGPMWRAPARGLPPDNTPCTSQRIRGDESADRPYS